MKNHNYLITVQWTGNSGKGTNNYQEYERNFDVKIKDKIDLKGSSDPAFRGDAKKHNPEELFLTSISSCHMLWYLHLCADGGVNVLSYEDEATAVMEESECGGRFIEVVLHPKVTVSDHEMISMAKHFHKVANERCFIANSLNFPVRHQPTFTIKN